MGLIPAGAFKGSWSGRLCRKAKDEALEGDAGNLSSQCPTATDRPGVQEKPVARQTRAVSREAQYQENYAQGKIEKLPLSSL